MDKKVSILLTDKTWLEGILEKDNATGIFLTDAYRSRDGEAGEIPIGKKILVPWSNVLFVVMEH